MKKNKLLKVALLTAFCSLCFFQVTGQSYAEGIDWGSIDLDKAINEGVNNGANGLKLKNPKKPIKVNDINNLTLEEKKLVINSIIEANKDLNIKESECTVDNDGTVTVDRKENGANKRGIIAGEYTVEKQDDKSVDENNKKEDLDGNPNASDEHQTPPTTDNENSANKEGGSADAETTDRPNLNGDENGSDVTPGKEDNKKPGDKETPGKEDNKKPGDKETPGKEDNKKPGDKETPGKEDNKKPGDKETPEKEDNKKPGDKETPGKEDNKKPGDKETPGKEDNKKSEYNNTPEVNNDTNSEEVTSEAKTMIKEASAEDLAKELKVDTKGLYSVAFDVDYYENGVKTEPKEPVDVTFTISKDVNLVDVYHLRNDGKVDVYKNVAVVDGKLTINVPSFSKFLVVEAKSEGKTEVRNGNELPKTGVDAMVVAFGALASLAGIGAFATKKRNK